MVNIGKKDKIWIRLENTILEKEIVKELKF